MDVGQIRGENNGKQEIGELGYLDTLPYSVFLNVVLTGQIRGRDLIKLCDSSPSISDQCNKAFKVEDSGKVISQYLFYLLLKELGVDPEDPSEYDYKTRYTFLSSKRGKLFTSIMAKLRRFTEFSKLTPIEDEELYPHPFDFVPKNLDQLIYHHFNLLEYKPAVINDKWWIETKTILRAIYEIINYPDGQLVDMYDPVINGLDYIGLNGKEVLEWIENYEEKVRDILRKIDPVRFASSRTSYFSIMSKAPQKTIVEQEADMISKNMDDMVLSLIEHAERLSIPNHYEELRVLTFTPDEALFLAELHNIVITGQMTVLTLLTNDSLIKIFV